MSTSERSDCASVRKNLHVRMRFCIFSRAEFQQMQWGVVRTASSVELLLSAPPLLLLSFMHYHRLLPSPRSQTVLLLQFRLGLLSVIPGFSGSDGQQRRKVGQKEEMEWKGGEWRREEGGWCHLDCRYLLLACMSKTNISRVKDANWTSTVSLAPRDLASGREKETKGRAATRPRKTIAGVSHV